MIKRYGLTRMIDAPVDTVWALLTDATSYADWNPAVVSIEGTIDAGTTIRLVSVANPKRVFTLTVTVMEPPLRMVWSDGMPLGLFKGERTYRLHDSDGRTEFSMFEVFSGPLAGLICKSIPDLTDSLDQFAGGLKTAAEQRAQHAARPDGANG